MSTLPRLNSGDLRHQITITRAVNVSDGSGGSTTTWDTVATPRAEVMGINGTEAVIGEALQGVSYYRIRIRWRAGIRAGDQILHDGQTLNITSVSDPNGEGEQLLILANTGSPRTAS